MGDYIKKQNNITPLLKQGNSAAQSAVSGIFNFIASKSVLPFFGYIITCVICYMYIFLMGNGLRVVYGDTWIYTDLAKRIAFNQSLRMDCVFDFIYPPLYSALISLAYYFREQAAIFEAIKIANILVYASAFVPVYYLLKRYAALSRNQSFAGAILLLINTYSLGYVFYITAEPLYFPLLAWLAWFLADMKHFKSGLNVLMLTLIFASIPLTKALGNLVFPSFIGATIIRYIYVRNKCSRDDAGMLIRRSVLIVIASAAILLLYNIYLRAVLPAAQTDISGGYLAFMNHPNIIKPSYWFDRTVYSCSWMLIVTGTVAVPLVVSIIIRTPKIIYEDYLASFILFALLSTFILVPLFTATDFMGDPHQRYYDPLMFLFMIILFKYRHLFALQDLVIAGVMTLLFCIIAPPFPLFIMADRVALIISNMWAVYLCIYVVAGAIFMSMLFVLYRYRNYFVNISLIMMAISMPITFYMKGGMLGPNMFGFNDASGITQKVISERSLNSKTEFIVDMSWRQKLGFQENYDINYWEYYKIMINIPIVPVFKDVNRYVAMPENKGKRLLVLSHENMLNAAMTIKGRCVSLFVIDL